MRTIYKQQLEITDVQTIEMHEYSTVLKLDVQNGKPCIWYECNTAMPMEKKAIRCFGTGHEIPPREKLEYIGTAIALEGRGVFHFYWGLDYM